MITCDDRKQLELDAREDLERYLAAIEERDTYYDLSDEERYGR